MNSDSRKNPSAPLTDNSIFSIRLEHPHREYPSGIYVRRIPALNPVQNQSCAETLNNLTWYLDAKFDYRKRLKRDIRRTPYQNHTIHNPGLMCEKLIFEQIRCTRRSKTRQPINDSLLKPYKALVLFSFHTSSGILLSPALFQANLLFCKMQS